MQPETASESKQHVEVSKLITKIAAETLGIDISDCRMDMGHDDLASWNSLNHLRLVTAVETEFSIRLSMRQVRNIRCLNDFVRVAIGEDLD